MLSAGFELDREAHGNNTQSLSIDRAHAQSWSFDVRGRVGYEPKITNRPVVLGNTGEHLFRLVP